MEFAVSSKLTPRMPMAFSLPSRMKLRIRFQIESHPTLLERPHTALDLNNDRYSSTSTIEPVIKKNKTLFIMGATCTGKSKLSVDIATHFQAEIINSDKMQFYKGLDIVTNKLAESERNGIPHHLLGFVEDPEADFTAQDFSNHVNSTITQIINNGSLPIIVGGSNNYIKQLVESPSSNFKEKFDSCFIWLDVAIPVLYEHAAKRVDLMVQSGLVEEVRSMVEPGSDYSRGVWRAIGVPEMDQYLYAEKYNADERMKKIFLDLAIDRIKENTCRLVDSQLRKIHDMIYELGWELHRIDATSVREKDGEEAVEAWNKEVLEPSLEIVRDFLQG